MRINTSGNKAYRSDIFERTADMPDEATKTGAIEKACIPTNKEARQKAEVMDYLRDRLAAGELEEVAEMLATDQLPISVEIDTSVARDL